MGRFIVKSLVLTALVGVAVGFGCNRVENNPSKMDLLWKQCVYKASGGNLADFSKHDSLFGRRSMTPKQQARLMEFFGYTNRSEVYEVRYLPTSEGVRISIIAPNQNREGLGPEGECNVRAAFDIPVSRLMEYTNK